MESPGKPDKKKKSLMQRLPFGKKSAKDPGSPVPALHQNGDEDLIREVPESGTDASASNHPSTPDVRVPPAEGLTPDAMIADAPWARSPKSPSSAQPQTQSAWQTNDASSHSADADPATHPPEVTAESIQALRHDLRMLQELSSCVGTGMGGGRDQAAGAAVAQQCKRWAEELQDMLMKAEQVELVAELLEISDELDAAMQHWRAMENFSNEGGSRGDLTWVTQAAPWLQTSGTADHDEQTKDKARMLEREVIELRMQLQGQQASHTQQLNQVKTSAIENMRTVLGQVDMLRQRNSELEAHAGERQRSASQIDPSVQAELREARAQIMSLEQQLSESRAEVATMAVASESRSSQLGQVESNRAAEAEAKAQISLQLAQVREQLKAANERRTAESSEHSVMQKQRDETEAALRSEVQQMRDENAALKLKGLESEQEAIELHAKVEELMRKADQSAQAAKDSIKEADHQAQLAAQHAEKATLELKRESLLRKKALNRVREMAGNIRVLARLRPARVGVDSQCDESEVVRIVDEYTCELEFPLQADATGEVREARPSDCRRFEFDSCFGTESTQAAVYSEVKGLLMSSIDGYNSCVFAYGQTGSGKTHTIMGNNTQPGILPRLSEDLFEMAGQSHVHIQVKLIMLELYQDSLIDLLLVEPSAGMVHKAKPAALEIKLDAKGNVSIPEATAEPANDMAQLNSLIAAAMKRRSTAATLMNFESSRSHLFVIMLLHVSNPTTGTSSTSKLTLVDLAGSERVTKSGSLKDRERLAEATSINKSLSALGDVVSALTTQNSGHVPYRNSKLTMLLADSLGGNAKTLLLVTLNPLSGNFAETKNSLEYAQRTKQVVNTASKSVETREIARLKAIIDKQSAELAGKKDKPKPTSLDPEIKSPGRRDRPLSATPVKRQNSLRS